MKKFGILAVFVTAVAVLAGCTPPEQAAIEDVIVVDAPEVDEGIVDDGMDEANDDIKDEIRERNEDSNADDTIDGAEVYTIDTEESVVNWKADRVLSPGHVGTVKIKEGSAVYIDSQLVSAQAVIDMTTIYSDDGERLTDHLKNEDFFDVENYPEATIVITATESVVDAENGDYIMATADLTIKGITNEITFPIYQDEYWTVATITIDRTLWDVRYGSEKFFDDLADKAIKDEIEFDVNIAYVM